MGVLEEAGQLVAQKQDPLQLQGTGGPVNAEKALRNSGLAVGSHHPAWRKQNARAWGTRKLVGRVEGSGEK